MTAAAAATTMETTAKSTKRAHDPKRLEKRLKRAVEKRELAQVVIKDEQEDLFRMFDKGPRKPREQVPEIQKKIDELEFERTTNSMSLSEERNILRQIFKLERLKRAIHSYESFDKEVKDKKELVSDLRSSVKRLSTKVSHLRTEIYTAKTADKLGCELEELVGLKVDVPEDKVGQVIGKKGSNVKQVMEKNNVEVNLNKVQGDMRIMGSFESIQAAASQVNRVVSSVEETLDLSDEVVAYLTARNIFVIEGIRKRFPETYVGVQRGTTRAVLRGLPEEVSAMKTEILGLQVIEKSIECPATDSAVVIGKQGATIDRLVTLHQATIHVERNKATEKTAIDVAGPASHVEAAILELEEMLESVKHTVTRLPVHPNCRSWLLLNGGKNMQELYKKVNDQVKPVFGSISINMEDNIVVIKARATNTPAAKEIVLTEIRRMESAMVRVKVDSFLLPILIGKGGHSIKKLTNGKAVSIEVDRSAGEVTVCGDYESEVKGVVEEINKFVEENQIERISIDASLFEGHYRDLTQQKSRDIGRLVQLDCDRNNSQVVLRGDKEKVKEAAEMVREFLAQNYTEEVQVTDDDMRGLLRGGKESKIVELSDELGVKLNSDRDRQVLVVKGEIDKVSAAAKRINELLYGGDGVVVRKVRVEEQHLGIVIGKGGKKKDELEKNYPAVFITISPDKNSVILRGPHDEAEDCRIEILNLIATSRIAETVPLNKRQHTSLIQSNAVRQLSQKLPPVQISMTDSDVTLRGCLADVRYGVAVVTEKITGTYECHFEIDASVFSRVRETCRQPSHFDRIEKSADVKLALDTSSMSIIIRGKHEKVKAAKRELIKLLDFVLASRVAHVDIVRPLRSSIGQASSLARVSSDSGARVQLDHDLGSVLLFSSDAAKVDKAVEILKGKINEAEKRMFVMRLEDSEDWIVSTIIGRNGNNIRNLRKETECVIDVESAERTIIVSCSDRENKIKKAREKLEALVETARKENAFVDIAQQDRAAFVGKAGAHIKEFQESHGVEVQLMSAVGKLRLSGKEDAVAAAKGAVLEWIAARETDRKEMAEDTVRLRDDQIPAVIGPKGSVIRGLEAEFGCRITIERGGDTVTIRGRSAEQREAAVKRIKAIAAGEPYEPLPESVLSRDRSSPKRLSSAKAGQGSRVPKAAPSMETSNFPPLPGNSKGQARSDEGSSDGDPAETDGPSWATVLALHPAQPPKAAKDRLSLARLLLDSDSDSDSDSEDDGGNVDSSSSTDDDDLQRELDELKKEIGDLRRELKEAEQPGGEAML